MEKIYKAYSWLNFGIDVLIPIIIFLILMIFAAFTIIKEKVSSFKKDDIFQYKMKRLPFNLINLLLCPIILTFIKKLTNMEFYDYSMSFYWIFVYLPLAYFRSKDCGMSKILFGVLVFCSLFSAYVRLYPQEASFIILILFGLNLIPHITLIFKKSCENEIDNNNKISRSPES